MQRLFCVLALSAAFGGVAFAQTSAGVIGPFNLQSGHVSKPPHDSGGKTADHNQCYSAESDRFIREGSWKIHEISSHGKNAGCSLSAVNRKNIDVVLPNGEKVPVSVVASFCVRAHAETGSGYSTDARTAWAECEVSAETVEYRYK